MTSSAKENASPYKDNAAPAPHDESAGILERRTVLAGLGVGALGLGATSLSLSGAARPISGTSLAAATRPACVLAPETIEGPYFVDEDLRRRDITEDRQGLPVETRITIVHGVECTPTAGAEVDVWHCDAGGWYSGHLDISPDVPATGGDNIPPTDPSRFLRGSQVTNRHGEVRFRTIYPGWYFGRAIHIHITVHVEGLEVHGGQLYFPESLNREVALLEPYVRHTGATRVPNEEDLIFAQQGGAQTVMAVRPVRPNRPSLGYVASITAGVIPGQTPPEPTFSPPPA